jgi:hypothetical protein
VAPVEPGQGDQQHRSRWQPQPVRCRQTAWLAGPLVWLAGMAPVCAESPPAPDAVISSEQQAADPAENLPDLGGAPDDAAREKQWAEMAKQLGEKDLNNVSRQQMRSRAEDYLLGQAADTLQQQAQELLSPLGTARLSLKMTGRGLYRQQRAVIQPIVRRRRIADLQPDRLAAAKRRGAGQFCAGAALDRRRLAAGV